LTQYFIYFSLITQIILPCLVSTQKEVDNLENNPEEFVSLSLDLIDKQVSRLKLKLIMHKLSKIRKTEVAILLETLCDSVDGCVTFFVNLCCLIIEYSIFSNKLEEIPTKYPLLQKIMNTKFFKQTTPLMKVEACLSAITIPSYYIPKRLDLMYLSKFCYFLIVT